MLLTHLTVSGLRWCLWRLSQAPGLMLGDSTHGLAVVCFAVDWIESANWWTLRPQQRPSLPFGVGWSANIGHVHVVLSRGALSPLRRVR